jgi:predicted lipid-binding transport protein (Tim44 family)
MNQIDSVTLMLLILVGGYWYWRAISSIGRPPVDLGGGKRTNSGPATEPVKDEPAPQHPVDAMLRGVLTEPDMAALDGLARLRSADRTFNLQQFLRGAVAAYEAVLAAFARGDAAALAELASAEVCDGLMAAIAERKQGAAWLELSLLRIDAATIVAAAAEDGTASVTVRFSSLFAACRRGEGNPEGRSAGSLALVDRWTFARALHARDPGWTLVATQPA